MATPKPEVAFIGLGAMGFGMATHLVAQGYPVTGFDVYAPTLARFAAAGGLLSSQATPASAVAGKPYTVCMVATAAQAQAVLLDGSNPAVPALPPGAVLLLCSTVPCAWIQALQIQLISAGRPDILLVDCPVSGGAARAADGTLSIMASGSEEALAHARPLLAELSDPTRLYIVPGGVGGGSNMKMVHQVLAAVQILVTSEAMGFAAQLGLDAAATEEAVLRSDAWAWMFAHRVPRMRTAFRPVASAVTIILKDAGIITSEARRAGFPAPMTGGAEQVYLGAVGLGYGPDDDSGLVRVYTNGLGKVGPVAGQAQTDEEKLGLVVDLLKAVHLAAAAEALAFAHAVGLDLDQVLDLCTNAAGGSKMLEMHGPSIVQALRAGTAQEGWKAEEGTATLKSFSDGLGAAMAEAQRLKVPLYLGSQALGLITQALRTGDALAAAGSVVKLWVA